MKATNRSLVSVAILGAAILFAVAGCRNPFQVGLGDKVDLDVPDLTLTSHPAGEYLSGTVTLGGVYTDDFEVASITLSLDDGTTLLDATLDTTNLTWQYVLDTSTYPDGEIELLLTITDASGKTIQKKILYYFDNTPPLVMVKNPQGYAANFYNGVITLRGEAADRFGISSVSIQIIQDGGTEPGGAELADGTNSWAFEFDTREYIDLDADDEVVVGLVATAVDRAGNVSETVFHYDDVLANNGGAAITIEDVLRIATGTPVEGTLITAEDIAAIAKTSIPIQIDNDLDKPTVAFVSPSDDGQNIGGSLLVTGTAYDDDGVKAVHMRIDLNGDDDFDDAFDLNGDLDTLDPFEDESVQVEISGLLQTVWTQDLNLDGELYQVEPGHEGRVVIEVVATDINDLVGNPTVRSVRFDDTIPRVESLSHITGDYVSGAFALTGEIQDDERIERVRISYDGGIQYTDIFNRDTGEDQGVDNPAALGTAGDPLLLNMPIDTGAIPGIGAITSDPLYLRLLIIDNAEYQALTYITLNVDNEYPTGGWDSINADPTDVAGASALLRGDALDVGTISGIAGAEVYFVRSGQIFNFNTGLFAAGANYDFGDGDGLVLYTPSGTADPFYVISIDDADEQGDDGGGNGDGDGYNEYLNFPGPGWVWYTNFDSTAIPDGALEIHYLIHDSAGNRNHYVEAGFIKNNKPSLSTVTLGTDLNANGDTIDPGERTVPPLNGADLLVDADTGFTAVNNRLYVGFVSVGGNGAVTYSLVEDGAPGTELVGVGDDFAVINTAGYAPDGVFSFTAMLEDSVGIQVSYPMDITIDNTDDTAPTIAFTPLSQSSVKGYGVLPEGHFDDDTAPPMDAEPDLSGIFNLDGSAHDDQRIQAIYLTIWKSGDIAAGYNSGLEFELASWDAADARLEYNDLLLDPVSGSPVYAANTWLGDTLDVALGHDTTFSFPWNSAFVRDHAEEDIIIDVRVEDFGTGGDGADSLTVDVVPYVTSIDTYLAGSLGDTLSRSADGAYPISDGEVVTVYGYNLNPTDSGAGTADVRMSIDPDALNGVPAKVGEDVVFGAPAADFKSVSVTVSATGSGYLTIFTGGIPSTNNINDSATFSYNRISSPTHVSLSDDLYVGLWELTELWQTIPLADNAAYPSMTLDGDTPAFAYVNNANGYGQARWIHGVTDENIYNNWDLFTYTAIDFNGSGDHGLLYDINVVHGGNGDTNPGNYGGILTSFFEDTTIPDQQWSPAAYYFWDNNIWLDNLVDPFTTAVLDRYQFPDLKMTGTTVDSSVFYSTYDRLNNEIIFRTFRVGTDDTIDNTSGGRINDEGTAIYTDIPQYNRNDVMPLYNGASGGDNQRFVADAEERVGQSPQADDDASVTVFTPTTTFGDHTAVAATSAGQAALVYFDEAGTGSLQYVYNATPTDSGTWSAPLPLATNTGFEYMDMEIDSTGDVHIAYYDSYAGDVHYVWLDSYDAGAFTNVIVDSYLIVGDKLSLALGAGNVPYLAYKGIGNSARVAWLDTGSVVNGVDGSDRYNGDWEVMTLPNPMADSDANRFGVGVRTSGTNEPVVGYTNSGLEYQRLLDPLAN